MIQKYREATEEEGEMMVYTKDGMTNEEYFKRLYETPEGKAFLETPQGKALLEAKQGKALLEAKQEEDRAYQYQEPALEEILAIEEQEAYQEGKYKEKKYIDEDGVWIPRIVGFLVFMLLGWLSANGYLGFEMFRYR